MTATQSHSGTKPACGPAHSRPVDTQLRARFDVMSLRRATWATATLFA
jgi:hypothetical protein